MADPKFDETEPASFEDTEAVADTPSFDDTAPISFDETEAVEPEARTKTALALGAAQGATMGWADEATAAVKAGWDSAINTVMPKDKQDSKEFKDRYKEQLTKVRDYLHKLEDENPKAFLGGEVAGGVGSLALPGGAIAKGLQGVLKVSKLSKPAQLALNAAIQGGVSGAGASEADKTADIAADAAKGATLGAALGAAAPAVGKLASKAIGGFKDVLEFAQRRGLGINKVANPEELTKFARDNNIITTSAEKTFANANKVRTEAGEALQAVTEQVQKVIKGPLIDKNKLVAAIEQIKSEQIKNGQNQLSKTTNQLLIQIKALNPTDFNQIRKIRTNIGEETSKYFGTPENKQKYRVASTVYGQLNDAITEGLTNLEKVIPDAQLTKQFVDTNKAYKLASQVAKAAEKHAEKDSGFLSQVIRRPASSIGPAAAGLIAAGTGAVGLPAAAVTTMAAYITNHYGPKVAASVQSMVEKSGPMQQKAMELVKAGHLDELAELVNMSAQRTAVQNMVQPSDTERSERKKLFNQLKLPQ